MHTLLIFYAPELLVIFRVYIAPLFSSFPVVSNLYHPSSKLPCYLVRILTYRHAKPSFHCRSLRFSFFQNGSILYNGHHPLLYKPLTYPHTPIASMPSYTSSAITFFLGPMHSQSFLCVHCRHYASNPIGNRL